MEELTNLTEFADHMRGLAPIDLKSVSDSRPRQTRAVMLAAVANGMELKSIKPLLDEYLTAPERKKGTAIVSTLASLVDLVNREKDSDSVLFADNAENAPSLLAVLDYHRAQNVADASNLASADSDATGAPRFGQYRVKYPFPVSKEWKAWKAKNGAPMSQGDFAEFLENRLLDVIEPPSAEVEADKPLLDMAAKLGGSFADPAKLLELSRGMAVHVAGSVKQIVNITSGETQVQFEETHQDAQGQPLRVPSLFLIGIPVFDDGAFYRLAVRLRYRKKEGSLMWAYEIYRADQAFDDAFTEACEKATDETALPLIYGKPAGQGE